MSARTRCRRLALAVPFVLLLGAIACDDDTWREGLVWSPDGSRAVLFSGDGGLYFIDANGTAPSRVASGVVGGTWLDSERLVLVRTRHVRTFREIASVIGPERTRGAVARAEAVANLLERTPAGSEPNEEEIEPLLHDDMSAIALYVVEHYPDLVRKHSDEKSTEDSEAELQSVIAVKLVDGRLQLGNVLYEDLGTIGEIRVTRDGHLIAFAHEQDKILPDGKDVELFVAATDDADTAMPVAENVAAHFDWCGNRQAVVYLAESRLMESEVEFSDGEIDVKSATALADVSFGRNGRVRCLRDGTVLFNAPERHLPSVESESAREQLFALQRAGGEGRLTALVSPWTLEQLPRSLGFFEVSPDESQVLVGGNGAIVLIGLADGRFEQLERPGASRPSSLLRPAWRRPAEFTWVRKTFDGYKLLLRRDNAEVVLNRTWSAETTQLLLGR